MGKRLAIIQSNYIPWKGYFDIIGSVDEFIVYDEVQYTKNDWRNRNRIKTANGVSWITIPVYQKSLQQKISETMVSDRKWAIRHWQTLQTNYGRAPHFRTSKNVFEDFYLNSTLTALSEINVSLIRIICDFLGIKTVISSSTQYELSGNPTERLVSLCKQTGSTTYLSGPAAQSYMQPELFKNANIELEWMDYGNYPEYPQLFPPFEHGVSILDLIFNTGPNAAEFLKFTKRCN
jgi:hypothetical protein